MADGTGSPALSAEQADTTIRSKQYVVLLVLTAIIGVVVSLAAWSFLELVHQIQQEVFKHLPNALGYAHGYPVWWPLPVLTIAATLVALAIARLPGNGGHIPLLVSARWSPPATAAGDAAPSDSGASRKDPAPRPAAAT